MEFESLSTQAGAYRIYAKVSRPRELQGVPVVLVHGLGASHRYLMPTADRLAKHYPVYVPDLPGFGNSGKPPRALTIPELADALATWMDAIGLPQAALLGNSMGCQVIVDLAARYPERVARAVLQGPSVDPHARNIPRQVLRLLLDSPREPLSQAPIILLDYAQCGLGRVFGTLQHMVNDPIEEKLPRVRCPTLVVRGARDPIVPQPWAEEATRLLPDGRLIVLPGCPHIANYAAPLELVRVVRPFLEDRTTAEQRLDAAQRHASFRPSQT